ncbi:hypothetical protein [Rhodococcus oxybenzonivorans]|nr:hypothetical protein [Rhodococcus oxybenzonivorans]
MTELHDTAHLDEAEAALVASVAARAALAGDAERLAASLEGLDRPALVAVASILARSLSDALAALHGTDEARRLLDVSLEAALLDAAVALPSAETDR